MPNFKYKARDKSLETVAGTVQAASADVAAELVNEQGLTLISLEEEELTLLRRQFKLFQRVKAKDLVIFSRQLAVIISAGIPLVQGLRILILQTSNAALQSVVSEVADDVEGGAKLSASLNKHPRVFSNFFISLIRSGETSGKLDEILNYLADQQEKDYDLRQKIRGGMIYPIFLLSGLAVVGTLMMIFVVPQLTSILEESKVPLPLSTRLLIGTSHFMATKWWLLLILLAVVVAGIRAMLANENGRRFWDTFRLRIPVMGTLFQKIVMVQFVRSLNTLLSGGVPLTRSLKIVADVVGSPIYKDLILETMTEVEDGNPITTVFARTAYVPPMVTQMMALGEKTGRLNLILDKLAGFYSREVDNTVGNLVTIMEPLVMVLIGVGVGVMVSAILLPLYNLANSF